jgi:hypothetical protein
MNAENAELKKKVEKATALLSELYKRLPDMLRNRARLDAGFRRRCYRRWKEGLDLLKMFLVMSEEYGSAYNHRGRPKAVKDQDFRFEAIVRLHARSLRVANEMLVLLREGYPDGALSRWRTLHELAVIATFLSANDKEVSERFLAHRGIVSYKALRQHEQYVPRSGMAPLAPGELDAAKQIRDALVQHYGKEFGEDMGWAYPAIQKARGINLLDLEEVTGLDHWRPRFKWASDDIHAGAKPLHASLGTAEVPLDKPVLVVGQSNSAFTDPAHMAVISLNVANHALPQEYRNEDDELVLLALRVLSDVIGEIFWDIDQRTGARSAKAMSARKGRAKGGHSARLAPGPK